MYRYVEAGDNEPLDIRQIAERTGVKKGSVATKACLAKGKPFIIAGRTFQRLAKGTNAKPGESLRERIALALEMGQEYAVHGDVKAALAWADRVTREGEELSAVLAGKAGLSVEMGGRVVVMRFDHVIEGVKIDEESVGGGMV